MGHAPWWQRGIVYQVYPRSFQDSDVDGVGDLKGILRRVDYFGWLGVDAVWLSPIYPSPMADFGYDVADYRGIEPVFGTLDDFSELVAALHGRGLKLILDLVPNHTSDRHPWFVASRSGWSDPKRDWYIWRDAAPDGGPPNNWLSTFGGSAWEWDAATGQYYYHAFAREQPDLNWRNPAVRRAVYDAMRFWLDRGVDGFRVDVMWHLLKDPAWRDNPPNPAYDGSQPEFQRLLEVNTTDQPDVHEIVAEMRALIDEYDDRVLIGEIYLPIERLVAYYGRDLAGAHLPFNFQLILTAWDAGRIAGLVERYEAALPAGAWPNWVLGNHDKPRIASRVGPAQARVAAMLLLTLRGTPTLYYGDEIGMRDVPIPPGMVHDPWEKNEPGMGFGRDPQRTPMQWDASALAGFTTGTPWLPLADDRAACNVEVLSNDAGSILALYRQLIELRRTSPALSLGTYRTVAAEGGVFAYERRYDGASMLVALNFGDQPDRRIELPPGDRPGRVLASTHGDRQGETVAGALTLRPDEGVIVSLTG
ncbi:MAG: alpha-amylase family glycosyl hydrolase [Thalassobaculum sp.]|uniref:alpha-amylase family glycosyl hydrolase n=1 Tax=Thalassobaculum sp. TaxID=2022740 RepID=UPI0032EFE089